jgi:hypothetical protein
MNANGLIDRLLSVRALMFALDGDSDRFVLSLKTKRASNEGKMRCEESAKISTHRSLRKKVDPTSLGNSARRLGSSPTFHYQ